MSPALSSSVAFKTKCRAEAREKGLRSVEELPLDNKYNGAVRSVLGTEVDVGLAGLGNLNNDKLGGLAEALKVRLLLRG